MWLAEWSPSSADLRLLSDASGAHFSICRTALCTVIVGGVLYNGQDLRTGLLERYPLPTSAALLVAQVYEHGGEARLQELRGIFAITIWDRGMRTLLCMRDPLGVYPLFYARAGRQLLLSTSIQAIVERAEVSRELNRAALADHLHHRWPDPEETYYAAVRRVMPGHILRISRSEGSVYRPRSERYWDPAPPDKPVEWVREEELERFDSLLEGAVSRYLSLGRAGIWLSGGLDSVTVGAVAANVAHRDGLPAPRALSLTFADPECNEEDTQRSVASQLGLPQTVVAFEVAAGERGLVHSALELSARSPAPLLNAYNPAYRYLSREGVSRGCRVVLTGIGGDEWLMVSPYYAADLLRSGDLRGLRRLWKSEGLAHSLSGIVTAYNMLWRFGMRVVLGDAAALALRKVAPSVYHMRRRRRVPGMTPRWLAPDPALRREIHARVYRSMPMSVGGGSYVAELRSSLEHALPAMDMEEYFESGRAVGAHVLHPFWDADLLGFLYRVPPELLNRGGTSKSLVREALGRRFPKLGFERQRKVSGLNFYQSLMLREGSIAWRSMGGTPALASAGIVDKAVVDNMVDTIIATGRLDDSHRIWDLLNLESWVRSRF
jgi:asparagine synthase (glutamine-hydrolysing)